LHLLATSLPWVFGIVAPRLPSGSAKNWDPRIRPLPDNARLYTSLNEAQRDGAWDWFLAHNINDLIDARELSIPKAFLIHGTLTGRILQDQSSIDKGLYLKNLKLLLNAHGARVVYISELKRRDWGFPGDVIKPGIDCAQYGGYRGNIPGILQVCHHLKERGVMMGWNIHKAVCRDLPSLVVGNNEGLPSSRMANSWADLKEQLCSYRVYLYTPVYPYEDGYNLALLEAMATGMPAATMRHCTSPIHDGVGGVVAETVEDLREKVVHLLENPQKAEQMGKAARIEVGKEFSIETFRQAWQSFAASLAHSK
jgi:hypothetical protein